MIDVYRHKTTRAVLLYRDNEHIGYIREGDGEILLNRGVMDTLTDDELLYLMKIGFKPGMWFGENNVFDRSKHT